MILYHYTSESAFLKITLTKRFMGSDPWTTMDAAYGHGFYFTDLPPYQCHAWIGAYCWHSLNIFEKMEYYLKFDIAEELVTRCRDHVYLVKDWDNTKTTYLDGGITLKCSEGACLTCDEITAIKQFLDWQ